MMRSRLLSLFCILLLAACATKKQGDVTVTETSRGVEIQSSNTILFDTGKADIKPGAGPFLDEVAKILTTKSKSSVLIEGHTDNVGNAQMNQDLSELRALMVMKALVDRGVDKTRIKVAGYGMTKPISDNSTEAGRQKNRRTDIVLLGEKKENLGKTSFDEFLDSIKNLFK